MINFELELDGTYMIRYTEGFLERSGPGVLGQLPQDVNTEDQELTEYGYEHSEPSETDLHDVKSWDMRSPDFMTRSAREADHSSTASMCAALAELCNPEQQWTKLGSTQFKGQGAAGNVGVFEFDQAAADYQPACDGLSGQEGCLTGRGSSHVTMEDSQDSSRRGYGQSPGRNKVNKQGHRVTWAEQDEYIPRGK